MFYLSNFWNKFYNANEFSWKKHPLLGPLCNFIVGILFMLSGWIYVSSSGQYFYFSTSIITPQFFIGITPYILSYVAVILLTDIPDIKGDLKNNKTTFLKSKIMEISSSEIRRKIKEKKSVKNLLPKLVEEKILKRGLYK